MAFKCGWGLENELSGEIKLCGKEFKKKRGLFLHVVQMHIRINRATKHRWNKEDEAREI